MQRVFTHFEQLNSQKLPSNLFWINLLANYCCLLR